MTLFANPLATLLSLVLVSALWSATLAPVSVNGAAPSAPAATIVA